MNEPAIIFTLDAPLSLHYDRATGVVQISTPTPMSDGTQRNCGIRLTPEGSTALLASLQHLETHEEKPPSVHAKPRTPQ